MKLGANSVLFGGHNIEKAFEYLSMAGYDGIELSAIEGMSEHLVLSEWRSIAPKIKKLSEAYNLELLAMEQPSQDQQLMEKAFQAAAEIGIPIINCGPGGKSDDLETLQSSIDSLGKLSKMAEKYGVILCVKAHVGASIYNTPTTLQVIEAISSPFFGIDMDPSIYIVLERIQLKLLNRSFLVLGTSISGTAEGHKLDQELLKIRQMAGVILIW